ncbi:MAG TPA: cyclic peptide export ABC transporter, partial [Ramlibacter sp.]
VLWVTALAALANAALLALVNIAAEQSAAQKPVGAQLTLLYLLAVATYAIANGASLRGANALLQQRLSDLRLRLADRIRRSDLRSVETLGRGQLFAIVAQETNHLAQNFPMLVGAAQSLGLVLFCVLYIAWLSLVSFIVILLAVGAGLLFFASRRRQLNADMVRVHASEAAMLEALTHFAEGFQEIRLNAARNESLFARFRAILDDLEREVDRIGRNWVVLLLFSNAFMYALLGVVVFVLPMFFAGYTDIIYKIAAAALFCVGPVIGVFSVAHVYSRAEIGLVHVLELERQLALHAPVEDADAAPAAFAGFRTITLEDIRFQYVDETGRPGFTTGPWSLQLQRGELLFLRGGNGNGKSTALKLLCGLYRPASGRILVDDVTVEHATLPAYRELFSAIFTDFHLFDRLHGLEGQPGERVRELIERMQLTHKVSYTDGRFSTLDLSTGQRKRLAMIVAQLEDREIYVFDEWAADQDSHFRGVFYTELLPDLRARGKTVVVVTHDERFWHLGDRLVTLEQGQMTVAPVQG